MSDPVVWFNPNCSKCRTTHSILSERGVDATYLDYQAEPPTVDELRRVLGMLGTDDARIGVASFLEHGPGKATFTGR